MKFIFLIYFLGFIPINTAFLPNNFQEKIIMSNLETIISSKAFSFSIFKNMKKEIDVEYAFLQISDTHIMHDSSYMYLSFVLLVLYGQLRFYNESEQYNKFRKIEKFSTRERFIKNIIFIFILIFMKDIQSVS